jgi:hypothetical protein
MCDPCSRYGSCHAPWRVAARPALPPIPVRLHAPIVRPVTLGDLSVPAPAVVVPGNADPGRDTVKASCPIPPSRVFDYTTLRVKVRGGSA